LNHLQHHNLLININTTAEQRVATSGNMLCQTYKELLISSKKESRIADMIYNRNSTAIFTYVASPTKSSAVPVSLSISLIIKSVVRSDTVKTKFSFHSGLVPFPVC